MTRGSSLTFKYLSMYLASGLDVVSSLLLTDRRIRNKSIRRTMANVRAMLERGSPLLDAFAVMRIDGLMDSVAWSILSASADSGQLQQACQVISEYARKSAEMKSSFAGSLAYPAGILLSSLGMIYFLMSVIFPKIMPLFSSLGMPLPVSTRALFFIDSLVRNYGSWIMALAAVLAGAALYLRFRSLAWKERMELALLFNPLSKALLMPREYYRISLAVSSLMKSGVTLPESLRVCGDASSLVMRAALRRVRESVETGKRLSEAVEDEPLFEHEWVHMLAAGEMTGSLPSVLGELSVFYEKQFAERLQLVARWSEPAALAVSAAVILAVALSVIQPMYAVIQYVHPV